MMRNKFYDITKVKNSYSNCIKQIYLVTRITDIIFVYTIYMYIYKFYNLIYNFGY